MHQTARSVHVPHDDVAEYTRVPVAPAYVPVNPDVVTSDPVTAPTLPPDAHIALVDRESQLPCKPVVLYARLFSGPERAPV